MKKILFIIVLALISTGCTAEYTIDIDNGFTETLNLYPDDSEETTLYSKETYRNPAYYNPDRFEDELVVLPNIERYNTSFLNGKYSLSYKFKDKFEDSNIANSSLENFTVFNSYNANIVGEDFTTIFAKYETLNRINVNIKTSKEVVGHNADYVNGNTYTWVVTRDNPHKSVEIYYINTDYVDEYSNQNSNNNQNIDPDPNNNVDPNQNNQSNNNEQPNNNTKSESKSNIVLYILYVLFFGLIFVIIIFRKKFNK